MQYVGETTTTRQTATKSGRCRGATPIELEPATVHARRRCAHGTHIVFVASNGLASTIMRGSLTVSVLNQSRDIHGVRATMCGPPCDAALLARHLQLHGPASACIVIKYATRQVHDYCRSQNMIVALDNVDNYRGFDDRELHGEHYQTVDALLVQTRQHAEWVGRRGGLRGVVMPHPHGNLNGWSLRHNGVRPHIREVGLVVGDAWRNMPTKEETVLLAAACCASNASLRLVFSLPNRRISTTRVSCPDAEGRATCLSPSCPNATDMGRLERLLQLDGRMQGSSPRRIGRYESDLGGLVPGGSGHGGSGESWCARLGARLATLDTPHAVSIAVPIACDAADASEETSELPTAAQPSGRQAWHWPGVALDDVTGQQKYYESTVVRDQVDVALLWRPGNQLGGSLAVANRPPTRLAWWWSHGVPTVGYPMVAYVEAARRVGYPVQLLNLTRPPDVLRALCAISEASTRHCLHTRAIHGAALTSPQASSLTLIAALCSIAEQCAPSGRLKAGLA